LGAFLAQPRVKRPLGTDHSRSTAHRLRAFGRRTARANRRQATDGTRPRPALLGFFYSKAKDGGGIGEAALDWKHKIRNILNKIGKADKKPVTADLHAVMNADDARKARSAARRFAERWAKPTHRPSPSARRSRRTSHLLSL
jgi:hypothetical protein